MPKTGTSPFFMPEIGQVERGQDIGKLTSAWYVFAACVDCGAGEAVQNMNLMFGFGESLGLEALPVYP